MRIFCALAFTLVLSACGSSGGGSDSSSSGGGNDYISNPPSNSTLPSGASSNSSGAGAAGGGTCGLAGRYGYCQATPLLADTPSVRIYQTIESNCTDLHLRVDYYTGANCTGSIYFTRLDNYTAGDVSASVVSGAVNVAITFVNRVETYSTIGRAGAHASEYKSCPSRAMSEFVGDTPVTSTSAQCDGTAGPIVDYNIAKVTVNGLFSGDQASCTLFFASSYKACTTVGARPTALVTSGIPPWN